MSAKLTTPWGEASLIERVTLPQRAGEKRFSSVVELLEGSRGERLVRFAYSTDGVSRRGPVTLRARDVAPPAHRTRADTRARRRARALRRRHVSGGGA